MRPCDWLETLTHTTWIAEEFIRRKIETIFQNSLRNVLRVGLIIWLVMK